MKGNFNEMWKLNEIKGVIGSVRYTRWKNRNDISNIATMSGGFRFESIKT